MIVVLLDAMTRRMQTSLLALLILSNCCLAGSPVPVTSDGITTVILVRHAERADDSRDAELSFEGRARADLLAEMLQRAQPRALFASEFRRTQQTLQPLAEHSGLPIRIIEAGAIDQLVAAIQEGPGGLVVVASHSDKIPLLITQLTGERVDPIDHFEYTRFYVLTLFGSGTGQVLELRFGIPPPQLGSVPGHPQP